jgi:diketogulonate reductase-like aldo/keto reductase
MSKHGTKLIYGTAWKEERTAELVEKAVLLGFRAIDTACQPKHYNERGVGEALIRLNRRGIDRRDLFVQTKFTPLSGHDHRVPYDSKAPLREQVFQSFATSQHNLGTSYVDSLVLHSPLQEYSELIDVWRSMEEICRSGGAKVIGISNCYDVRLLQRLFADSLIKPAIVQNRFYSTTRHDCDLRKFCKENDIRYQSFWTLTANPELLRSPSTLALAREHKKTPAQVLFRYLTLNGVDPLTGTTSEQHMREDLDIFTFTLSPDEQHSIARLLD